MRRTSLEGGYIALLVAGVSAVATTKMPPRSDQKSSQWLVFNFQSLLTIPQPGGGGILTMANHADIMFTCA